MSFFIDQESITDTCTSNSDGSGSISGTLHVVTTDGAGPFTAIVDPTGTGQFASGIEMTVSTQVPGNKGNIKPNGTVNKIRSLLERMNVIQKRAANVNKDFVSVHLCSLQLFTLEEAYIFL
jgi:hypothetical protein